MNIERVTFATCRDDEHGCLVIIYRDDNTYLAFKIDVPVMEKFVCDLQELIAENKRKLETLEQGK